MTGPGQDVLFDVDSCRQEFSRELVTGCAHGVPVGIDHEGWREAVQDVPSGKRERVSQRGRCAGIVAINGVMDPSGMREPAVAT